MRTRALSMLVLAVLLAGGAVYMVRGMLAAKPAPVAVEQKTTPILVARARLEAGAIVRPEHVRLVPWPAKFVPAGAFQKPKDLFTKGEDRVALRPIEINEPILKTKVSGFGGRASLSALISEDRRAVTIPVNNVLGVAGFVLPGDRVDVLLTRIPDPGEGRRKKSDLVTDVLLQNVMVLAVDQDANTSKDKPKVAKAVTLEVTQEQAQKLVLAQRVGTLSLTLRHVSDVEALPARTVTLRDLKVGEAISTEPEVEEKPAEPKVAASPAPAPAPAAEPAPVRNRLSSVNIVRGLKKTEVEVEPETAEPQSSFDRGASLAVPRREGAALPKSDAGLAARPAPHKDRDAATASPRTPIRLHPPGVVIDERSANAATAAGRLPPALAQRSPGLKPPVEQ